MEDTFIALPQYLSNDKDMSLFAVLDGHRGPAVADHVAKTLPERLAELAEFKSEDYSRALQRVNQVLDDELRRELEKRRCEGGSRQGGAPESGMPKGLHPFEKSGCTIVVVLRVGTVLYTSGAGDCRAIIGRGRRVEALSVDHKPSDPSELARIKAAGGRVDKNGRINGNLGVARAIGDLDFKPSIERMLVTSTPAVSVKRLDPGDDLLVLATDGLWDCRANAAVMITLSKVLLTRGWRSGRRAGISAALHELLVGCLCADPKVPLAVGADNMTVIAARLDRLRPWYDRLYCSGWCMRRSDVVRWH